MSETPADPGALRIILQKAIVTLETISSVIILIMMILTFADVIGRYVFHSPVFGGTEIIGALLALAIFSGLGVINARDEHITVELFEVPIRRLVGPLPYHIITQSFSVVCMTLIAAVMFEQAWESYLNNKLTVVLEMPVYYVTGTVAVFAVISVISQVAGIAVRISNSDGRRGPIDQ